MILVTGGTGFIGSHLLDKLSALGEPARCLMRRKARPRRLPAGIEAVYGDLISGEGVEEAVRGADTVIHLAGVTKALAARDYYAGNVRATEMLLRALAGRAVRLVHVSTLAAIGPSRDGKPVDEDAPPRPLTHYGKSKLEAERMVRALAPDAVIVRPPVVYGPRDTDVFQILRSISKGWVLEIAGGERWFSAIYVGDLVEGLLAAIARTRPAAPTSWRIPSRFPGASWAPPPRASWLAGRAWFACRRLVAYAVGLGAEVWSHITRKPGIISREKVAEARCRWWTCDTRRAAAELGFEARTPLEPASPKPSPGTRRPLG